MLGEHVERSSVRVGGAPPLTRAEVLRHANTPLDGRDERVLDRTEPNRLRWVRGAAERSQGVDVVEDATQQPLHTLLIDHGGT